MNYLKMSLHLFNTTEIVETPKCYYNKEALAPNRALGEICPSIHQWRPPAARGFTPQLPNGWNMKPFIRKPQFKLTSTRALLKRKAEANYA
jgi:hypothetical protein